MTKISVFAPTGEKVEADLVRFFEAYAKKYLVYTLNEKDEQEYVKLYVSRIDTGADGKNFGEFIEYNDEWGNVKDEFKKMITNNGAGVNDIDPIEIANINIKGHRIIKLLQTNVDALSANQKQFAVKAEPVSEAMNVPGPAPEIPSFEEPAPAQPDFGFQETPQPTPQPAPSFEVPKPFPETPTYVSPIENAVPAAAPANNYEQMYNELKVKYERCSAELEKVTNENIDLRIKIDDIREILDEN